MKKILLVSESLARGGMERILVDISNALVERNYDVTVVLYGQGDALKDELDKRVHLSYVPRKPLKIRRNLPYFHRRYRNDKWEKRASSRTLYNYYVGHKKYDVEIGFYRGPSIKIVSGSKNRKSKKLAWVHTDVKLCDPKSLTKFFNDIEEVKAAYSKFDNIVCVSDKAGESFSEVIGLNEKISTIYNMISCERIQTKSLEECELRKNRFTFISVGRQIPDKGYMRLLSSVRRLNEEGYEFDLWLIGGGRDEENLHAYAKENNLQNVIFAGMQDNPFKYVRQADLFICSSVREGFNIAVAESLSLGVPVMTTRCTGPTEILGDGEYGIIVDNNEEGLYLGMKRVLDNKDILKPFAEKAKDRSLTFDENNIMQQIIELIEN